MEEITMGFTPLEMDGEDAARTMLSWGTYPRYRCLEAVHNAFPFERSDAPGEYQNAIDEWNRCPTDRRHPGDRNPPSGAILLFDLYVRSLGYNAGHIMIAYGGGENAVSTDRPTYGKIGMTTISQIEKDWGGTYLGWTNRIGGHTVITHGGSLGPRQRRVGAEGVKRRAAATRASESLNDPLAAGDIGNFQGFVHGEAVDGNDIWFVGDPSGNYFHSSGFDGGADVSNLPDLTPRTSAPATTAYQRVVTGDGVYERTGPSTASDKTGREFAAGEILDFNGWTHGETINLNGVSTDVWFRGAYAGMWFSAACFTSQSTDGLTEVKAAPAPSTGTPAPSTSTPTPTTTPEWKNRTPDTSLAKWIGSPNFNYRDPRPVGDKPTHVTMHWMAGNLASADAQFQKLDPGSSATYGVGLTEIHQYVREIDYQQADGNTYSNRTGLSIEHEGSPSVPVAASTMALSANLLADRAKHYGWTEYRVATAKMSETEVDAFAKANPTICLVLPHNNWVATQCPGTLDYTEIVKQANAIIGRSTTPTQPDTVPVDRSKLKATYDWLKSLLGIS